MFALDKFILRESSAEGKGQAGDEGEVPRLESFRRALALFLPLLRFRVCQPPKALEGQ